MKFGEIPQTMLVRPRWFVPLAIPGSTIQASHWVFRYYYWGQESEISMVYGEFSDSDWGYAGVSTNRAGTCSQ